MTYSVALFHSVSAALRAEKELVRAQFKVKLIPTPRQLSSDCGVAMRFPTDQRAAVEATLNEARLDLEGIHELP